MFEYKVKCRHKLGWKEIKLYADTDIEEFFNRNSIDYVRNMTDTVEHRQLKEIERLKRLVQKRYYTMKDKLEVVNIFDDIQRCEIEEKDKKIERLNKALKDIKHQLEYLETYSSKEDVYEDMSRRLNNIESIVNKVLGSDKE